MARPRKAARDTTAISDYWAKRGMNTSSMLDRTKEPVKRLSTGSWFLDEAIGGGVPYGGITEIYGDPGSGKTTMALTLCREVEKAGGVAFFIDAEHKMNDAYAERIGVQRFAAPPDDFVWCFENIANLIIKECADFAKTFPDTPFVIVWDSMANTQTEEELKADIGNKPMDGRPAMMRHFLTKLIATIAGTSIIPVLVNQTYVKYGGSIRFGEKTPKGGSAQKQMPTVCLRTTRSNKPILDNQKNVLGYRHTVHIEKSELGPGENVGFAITHASQVGYGINDAYILFHELRDAGVIQQKASWSVMGERKWQSTWTGFLETLNANPGLKEELFSTYKQLQGGKDATLHLPKS